MVLIVKVLLVVIRVHRRRDGRIPHLFGQRRVIAKLLIVHVEVNGVEAESINTSVQPEPTHVQKRLLNLWIVEVQVGLRH